MSEGQRVCAVVVTYNRKVVLAECLEALLAQSYRVDHILIIDNASTDGTGEFLRERRYTADGRVEHVLLPVNVGGAGGFHAGFKRALELQPDWVWAMDDDGVAMSDTLAILLAASSAGLLRAPLVLAAEDPNEEQLAFPDRVQIGNESVVLSSCSEAERRSTNGLLRGHVSPFNGVLIHQEAVRKIGLPRAEFFIWGDEWDYVLRARRLGIMPTAVVAARFRHPLNRTRQVKLRLAKWEWSFPVGDTPMRRYLIVRNYAYIASRHRGILSWLRHTLKYLLYYTIASEPLSPWTALKYSLEGLLGRLRGHEKFIGRAGG